MRRVPVLAVALLAIAVAQPAVAVAQDNSGIDQYTENVPAAGGENAGNDGAGGSGPTGTGTSGTGSSLPEATAEQLEAQGADGGAAAQLAESTAPEGANEAAGSNSQGESPSPGNGSDLRSDSGDLPSVGDVVDGVADGSGSEGLGLWLPILLGVTLLAAITLAIVRWRRGPGEPTHG